MKKFTTLFFVFFLGLATMTMAQNNWIGIHNNSPVGPDVRLIESNINKTSIQFSVDGFFENAIRTPRGTEMILSLKDGILITEEGMPDMAKLYTNIIIPDLYQTEVKIVSAKYEEFQNIAVAPSKGHFTRDIRPEDVPFVYGDAYNEDAFWPGDLAQLEEPFIMRDFRGQTVTVFPFQYNPVSQTLRVYTDIILEVISTGEPGGADQLTRKSSEINIEREFGFIYNRFFLNMEAASKSYQLLEGEEGSLLIIAHDPFMEAMQPFVDWKRTTGRKTVLVSRTEAGNTAAGIKSFVQEYYDENPDFAHLLLVGDAPNQMPVGQASGGQSDNWYGFLVGNNSYNDIFVGRFSAETVAHVETQVQRMIEYERDLNSSDTWLGQGMGIARNEGTGSGHNGENDYQHMDFIRDTLLNYTYTEVLKRYDGNVPGVPNTNAAQMSADFNEGVGIVNFCNHGSVTGWSVAGYNISHVNQLTNVGKLPFIWSVACVNGAFVNTFCFAEAWMRATHEGEPTGAIGIMAATINQPWQPPMTGQDEMVMLLAEGSIVGHQTLQRTFGGISINGSMSMIPAHGASGTSTHQTWILFGDPTLRVRTATPEPIVATYNPVILIGTDTFEVNVADADGATVALTYYDMVEEEVVIAGTGVVDGGVATVNFDVPVVEPGMFTLTIMGFNKETYMNTEIQVIPPDGPYVVFDYYEINDIMGNNNNQADYGETIRLNVSLKNVGIEKAENVSAILTTESEYVTILENEQFWGEIEEDGSLMIETAFKFEVAHVIPNNHNVLFTLEISGQDTEEEEKEWNSNLAIRIFSPLFTISDLVLDDSQGNDNGLLEPGETAELIVTYTNTGGAPAMSPVSHMIASSPYLTIENDVAEPGIILPGESAEVAYVVHAHESTIEGTFIDLNFTIEDAHFFESEQLLVIGQVPEMQLGDGTAPSNQYPFYNYYKANRSQMLYTAEEIGSGEKTILEIGFDIIQVATQHNNLPNFTIRMMHVDQNTLTNFVNTANAEVVFEADAYQMPTTTGWHTWEIEHFEYDGESNLLVEIVWGLLDQWTTTFYRVASTNVGANRVAYGFTDWNAVPGFNGVSNIRPNIYFAIAAEESAPSQVVEFVVKNQLDELVEGAEVKVGSMKLSADDTGITHLLLQPGTYLASAEAYSHQGIVNQEFVVEHHEEDNGEGDDGDKEDVEPEPSVFVELLLTRLFNASFVITNKYGHDVSDAEIILNDHTYQEGHYEFHYMLPGVYTYTISRESYFDYMGEFELLDTHETIEVVLQPDGTDVAEISQHGIAVYPNPFRQSLQVQLAEGIKGDVQILDILGNVVFSRASVSGSNTFELGHLPAGNYFIRIISENGTDVFKVSRLR